MSEHPGTEHPSPRDLEALQAGEPRDDVASHVEGCEACAAYVSALDGEQAALLRRESGAAFARRLRTVADAPGQPDGADRAGAARASSPGRAWMWGPALAAAAAVALIVLWPATGPDGGGLKPLGGGGGGDDVVRLKGGPKVALIVLRDGVQTRHEGATTLRPGDRLRVEVTVPEAAVVTAGILADDGTWVPLLEGARLEAGTHTPTKTLTADAQPLKAHLLVGSPEAVAAARRSGDLSGLLALPIDGAPQ